MPIIWFLIKSPLRCDILMNLVIHENLLLYFSTRFDKVFNLHEINLFNSYCFQILKHIFLRRILLTYFFVSLWNGCFSIVINELTQLYQVSISAFLFLLISQTMHIPIIGLARGHYPSDYNWPPWIKKSTPLQLAYIIIHKPATNFFSVSCFFLFLAFSSPRQKYLNVFSYVLCYY